MALLAAGCWPEEGDEPIGPGDLDVEPEPGPGPGLLVEIEPALVGAAETAICEPAAAELSLPLAPEMRQWVLEAEATGCALTTVAGDAGERGLLPAGERLPTAGEARCDASGACRVALPPFVRSWAEPADRDSPLASRVTEHWVGLFTAWRELDSGELEVRLRGVRYNSSAVRTLARRYDAEGRLLSERFEFNGFLWFSLENEWEGDRLVAARWVDDINGGGLIEFQWSYDEDGRLIRGTSEQPSRDLRHEVSWSYDAAGRPASVERRVDGEPWLRQRWSVSDEGVLEQRTSWLRREAVTASLRPLDDHAPPLGYDSQSDWSQSATVEACQRVPVTVGHGYPAADGVYDLGFALGDRPHGIDVAYGFASFYDSAQSGWYGHDGVGGGELGRFGGLDVAELEVVTEYDDAGAMVAEEQQLLTTAGEDVLFERTRSLNDAGALLTDRRLGPDGVVELRFTYDEDGRLVARRALRDGELTAVHRWEYGACGVTRHGIARTELEEVDEAFGDGEVHPLPGLPVELPIHESFERRYSEGCLVTESLRAGTLLEAVRRDELGQVIERWGALSREAYRYDPDTGLRVFEGTDWDGDERFDISWDHELSEENLLVRRDWQFASSSLSERYTYRCGG